MSVTTPESTTDRFCAGCGYNLRGIASERCPECGTAFDPTQSVTPQIPWSHRHTIGRRKAFWRTVFRATFRTQNIAAEIDRPVSLDDALAFRRRVVWHAYWPIALASGAGYLYGLEMFDRPWWPRDVTGSIGQWLGLLVLLMSLWLFLYFATGMLSYFYHPRRLATVQQNRAVALSYYACAPWALIWVVAVAAGLAAGVVEMVDNIDDQPLPLALTILLGFGPLVVWIGLIWFVPQRMLHKTTHCGYGKLLLVGFVIQPIAYLLCAVLTVGLLNAVYWMILMMILGR